MNLTKFIVASVIIVSCKEEPNSSEDITAPAHKKVETWKLKDPNVMFQWSDGAWVASIEDRGERANLDAVEYFPNYLKRQEIPSKIYSKFRELHLEVKPSDVERCRELHKKAYSEL